MGGTVSKKTDENVVKFAVLGFPCTGKTSLVHRLDTGEKLEEHQNPHSNRVEIHILKDQYGMELVAFDYACHATHHVTTFHFARTTCLRAAGIIYMIDSSDTERLTESLEFLNELYLQMGMGISPNMTVMVVANKQDLDDAVGPEVIEESVKKICKIRKGISMFVMPMSTNADDDHSLQLAYRLFLKTMVRKRRNKIFSKYKPGLTLRAWETAEKVAEDSDVDDGDGKEGNSDKKKNMKSYLKDLKIPFTNLNVF